jgi:hypothetical protein
MPALTYILVQRWNWGVQGMQVSFWPEVRVSRAGTSMANV